MGCLRPLLRPLAAALLIGLALVATAARGALRGRFPLARVE